MLPRRDSAPADAVQAAIPRNGTLPPMFRRGLMQGSSCAVDHEPGRGSDEQGATHRGAPAERDEHGAHPTVGPPATAANSRSVGSSAALGYRMLASPE